MVAGGNPAALTQRPTVARPRGGCPARHGHHFAFHVQVQGAHEPQGQFAHGEAVAHGQRAGAHEALPTRAQGQSLHRSSGRVGPIQHQHLLVEPGRRLQDITQGGDEGVDAATQVLQVHQQHVEAVHHGWRGSTHLAVETEHRDTQRGVTEVRGLHHVVLLVAAQTMLGTEGGAEPNIRQSGKRVQRMGEVGCHSCRMGQQSHTTPLQAAPQRGLLEQAIDAELHGLTPQVG